MSVTHYVVVDSNGFPIGWYNDDIYPPTVTAAVEATDTTAAVPASEMINPAIPSGAIPLTEAQWQDCIDNSGYRQIVNGAPVAYTPPTPAPVIPTQVPMWALQAALQISGKYSGINQTVTGWATSTSSQQVSAYFAWTMGNFADRSSVFISTFASQFGFASADIDALFQNANGIATAG